MAININTLDSVPEKPGIYFYKDIAGTIIYVGKAKNLKKRVSSYFSKKPTNKRTAQLVNNIHSIEVICTENEHTALLTENEMIKKHQPRYNVLLKDGKSYPYLYLSNHTYPRMGVCRSKKVKASHYFGPYTSKRHIYHVLDEMQKIFQIRTCTDNYFSNRSRPCLLHQIGRCSAPCVNKIKQDDYANQIEHMKKFLKGNYHQLIEIYTDKMLKEAEHERFEQAAHFRDIIQGMQSLLEQEQKGSSGEDIDVISAIDDGVMVHIQMLMVRNGQIKDTQTQKIQEAAGDLDEVIASYILQYYLEGGVAFGYPKIILAKALSKNKKIVEDGLNKILKRKVKLVTDPKTEQKKRWQKMVDENLTASYRQQKQEANRFSQAFEEISSWYAEDINSIECFDISHTQGKQTYASCVVFRCDGPHKASYRTYKLSTGNDDYASMAEVLNRRYKNSKTLHADLVLIDGGKGQLSAAVKALEPYGIEHKKLLAIAKDAQRKSGMERYYVWDFITQRREINPSQPCRRLLENIRDEAHRFAITQHRKARGKVALRDSLLDVEGLGDKKYQRLLQHFGSMQLLQSATVKQLKQVKGISNALAERIHEACLK